MTENSVREWGSEAFGHEQRGQEGSTCLGDVRGEDLLRVWEVGYVAVFVWF